ncbi:hypothetical protein T440DRAFT_527929 [Plenodomus tracheiphilus IPT5]|uniref:Uncharacterized protein n=1 Tax=Plenodomus tracheiphilus IPT5 TaxID=1408161 RepID=A0A6A7AM58_9PLEO|nr:hypothetical protein T440DRAFT_527929 [Plenodomus tracheiphilus IPT5]
MSPLSYNRLLARLDSLFDALPTQFPHPDDAARLHDLKRAIKSGQVSAQRGVNGEGDKVLSPGRLKRWVNAKVQKIHDTYDEEAGLNVVISSSHPSSYAHKSAQRTNGVHIDQNDGSHDMEDIIESIEQPSPHTDSSKENANVKREHPAIRPTAPPKQSAVTKRIIRGNNIFTGVKKTASKRTRKTAAKARIISPATPAAVIASLTDREAAIALLGLANASRAIGHERKSIAVSTVAASTLGHLKVPAGAYNAGAAPRQVFLAGVQYAMDNYESLRSQMNGSGNTARRGFWDVV